MKHTLATFTKNFLACGFTGWCMEIIFTSLNALRRREMTLRGNTSLWMFPIYGSAALLAPVCRLLKNRPLWLRGAAYMSLIYSVEYFTGKLLSRYKLCPWDYSRSRFHVDKVIRLDYAPYWFGAGLVFERLVSPSRSASGSPAPKTLHN